MSITYCRNVGILCLLVLSVVATTVGAQQPDLVPNSLSCTDCGANNTVQPGNRYSVSYTVRNAGTSTASVSGGWNDCIHLSVNANFADGDDSGGPCSNKNNVAAGASYSQLVPASDPNSVNIPNGWPAGTSYLLLMADRAGFLSESNESNNLISLQITVQGTVQYGSVAGNVKDANSHLGIPNASVTLTGNNNYNTTTDSSGNFTFGNNNIVTGSYTITASATGYNSVNQTGFPVNTNQTSPWYPELLSSQQIVATPVVLPSSGNYSSSVSVSITCATSGATIRYTTDGSDVSGSSPIYPSGGFSIPGPTTVTVKARGYKAGYVDSAVGSATYVISPPPDTTAPTVSILSPTNNQTFAAPNITVSGTANDPGSSSSGVALVEVRLNGGNWQTAQNIASWSRSLVLSSGANIIEARSKDGAGNYSSIASVSVAYNLTDTTIPIVAISSPTDGQTFTTSSITVTGTASDPGSPSSGVSLVEVRVNSGSWQPATGTTGWSRFVTLSSGSNTIEVRSKNGAGNYSSLVWVTVTYNPLTTGSLRVTIEPPEARTAGAQWRIGTGSWRDSGVTLSNLSIGEYPLQFKDISGWSKPEDRITGVSQGNTTIESGYYICTDTLLCPPSIVECFVDRVPAQTTWSAFTNPEFVYLPGYVSGKTLMTRQGVRVFVTVHNPAQIERVVNLVARRVTEPPPLGNTRDYDYLRDNASRCLTIAPNSTVAAWLPFVPPQLNNPVLGPYSLTIELHGGRTPSEPGCLCLGGCPVIETKTVSIDVLNPHDLNPSPVAVPQYANHRGHVIIFEDMTPIDVPDLIYKDLLLVFQLIGARVQQLIKPGLPWEPVNIKVPVQYPFKDTARLNIRENDASGHLFSESKELVVSATNIRGLFDGFNYEMIQYDRTEFQLLIPASAHFVEADPRPAQIESGSDGSVMLSWLLYSLDKGLVPNQTTQEILIRLNVPAGSECTLEPLVSLQVGPFRGPVNTEQPVSEMNPTQKKDVYDYQLFATSPEQSVWYAFGVAKNRLQIVTLPQPDDLTDDDQHISSDGAPAQALVPDSDAQSGPCRVSLCGTCVLPATVFACAGLIGMKRRFRRRHEVTG